MALDKIQIQAVYRRRARHYDAAARLYDLAGFAEARYRREAVEALRLRPGARVVEIGCGTGLNLPHLVRAVGPAGQVFGVDLTDAMLLRACERVRRAGWTNVRLIQADAARYQFPPSLDGVLATFALTLVPEFDDVVRRGARALTPGGRFVVLDLKRPEHAPSWLVRLAALANRPFGASLDLADRHPWESVARHLPAPSMTELYHGFAYLCAGEARRGDRAAANPAA